MTLTGSVRWKIKAVNVSFQNVVALIPARSGSKGVKNKNVREVGGHPLIAYSVVAAKNCIAIDRVIVTTDSQDIADVAVSYGAEVPFLRPADLSGDRSPDIDYIRHAIEQIEEQTGARPELIVQVRPTTPLRDPVEMANAIAALQGRPDATSLRSVQELAEPPQKMMGIEEGLLSGLFPHDTRPEYYNLPRQAFAPAYLPNGYIDIVRCDYVLESGNLYGPKVLAFNTEPTPEIDTKDDLQYLEFVIEKQGHVLVDLLNNSSEAS
ncbi:MAG: acylneuraminate cytidylyltransferase family protein [Magnetovibrio sp.]|nr:acylneuraminate cytidylyltransferase family protein [Magnetovibrio sp.]